MDRPLISVLHPTARVVPSEAFPRGWRDVFDAWLSRADHPERIEYVLSVHESRRDEFISRYKHVTPGWAGVTVAWNSDRDNCVDNLNNAAKHSTGKLLVGTMDDYYPPEHWDTLLLEALPWYQAVEATEADPLRERRTAPMLDQELILVCSSGNTPERDRELMIAGALTRKRYERYGFILDPDFESMFSDNWYAHVARRDEQAGLCRIIERLDIQFEHRHPIFGKGQMDDVYAQQNRAQAYMRGQAIFMKKTENTKSIAVCLPGEFFRGEIFWDRLSLIMHLNRGNRFLVAPFGRHSSNVYHTRTRMTRELLENLPDVDFVLWLDDDNSLSVEQFEMLYASLEAHPKLSGIVGWCWCDHNGKPTNEDGTPNPWKMSVGVQGSWEDGLPAWNLTLDDFVKARKAETALITSDDLAPNGFWSGFPVVLLRGDCVRELGPLAFTPLQNDKFIDGFTGEDASFFYRARQAGMKFAVDLRVQSNHCKFLPITPPRLITKEGKDTGEFASSEDIAKAQEATPQLLAAG